MLEERLSLSERRACRITGQHRSTQRHRPLCCDRDDALRARLRRLSREHPRWGYRRAWASLRGEGFEVNRKKIQRLWREEGLRVPARKRKRQRLGQSTAPAGRLRAEGWNLNRKRVQRIWREEGLRVPERRRKRRRLGTSTVPAARLRAAAPDQVWALAYRLT